MQETKPIFDKLRSIFTGQESVKIYLEFLKRNNKTDHLILKHTKVDITYLRHCQPLTRLHRTFLNRGPQYIIPRLHCKMRSCMLERHPTSSYATTWNGSPLPQIGPNFLQQLAWGSFIKGTLSKA